MFLQWQKSIKRRRLGMFYLVMLLPISVKGNLKKHLYPFRKLIAVWVQSVPLVVKSRIKFILLALQKSSALATIFLLQKSKERLSTKKDNLRVEKGCSL